MKRSRMRPSVAAVFGAAIVLATSAAATVAAPPADNDDFANARTIAPASLPYADERDGTGTGTEGFEAPDRCADDPTSSIWYRITPNFSGWLRADTRGSDGDNDLTVYEGTTSDALTEIACNDDMSGDSNDSRLTFEVSSGLTYYIRVGDVSTQVDMHVRRVTAPRNDDFANAKNLNGKLPYAGVVRMLNATYEYGEPDAADIGLGCSTADPTVWYTILSPKTKVINAHTLAAGVDTVIAVYQGDSLGSLTPILCNDDTSQEGEDGYQSNVSFIAEAGVRYYVQVGGYYGNAGQFGIRIKNAKKLANDLFANAETIAPDGALHERFTRYATIEANEPQPTSGLCFSRDAYSTLWYRFTPSASGDYVVDTSGSDYEMLTTVYTGSSIDSLTEVGCNTSTATMSFSAESGTTYWIQVAGSDGDTGYLHLHLYPAVS